MRQPGGRAALDVHLGGRLQDEGEILVIIKTTADRLAQLTSRLQALHPYDLPELVTIAVTGGNERYLEWV